MSKMSDMAMTIEELRNAAAAINDVATGSHSSLEEHPKLLKKQKPLLLLRKLH